jgi:hypothetical protein
MREGFSQSGPLHWSPFLLNKPPIESKVLFTVEQPEIKLKPKRNMSAKRNFMKDEFLVRVKSV